MVFSIYNSKKKKKLKWLKWTTHYWCFLYKSIYSWVDELQFLLLKRFFARIILLYQIHYWSICSSHAWNHISIFQIMKINLSNIPMVKILENMKKKKKTYKLWSNIKQQFEGQIITVWMFVKSISKKGKFEKVNYKL